MTTAAELHLRPMRPDEFVGFRAAFVRDWALDLARVEDLPISEAERRAAQRTDADLPDGVATPGHHLFVIVAGGDEVGTAWLSVTATGHGFLDDITLHDSFRGRGYGRRALALVEARARELGLPAIELHVYAHNPRAIALYQALGYGTTGLKMRKRLASDAGRP